MNSCKIRFNVQLSEGMVGGKTAPATSANFSLNVGIEIRRVEEDLVWQQLDKPDDRMPDRGRAEVQGNDLFLYRMNGGVKEAVAVLIGFPVPPGPFQGGIDFLFMQKRTYTGPGATWRGHGKWQLLFNNWVENKGAFPGSLTKLTTNWRVTSTGGGAVGAGPSWTLNGTAGSMLIEDPSDPKAKRHKIVFGGLGGGYGISTKDGSPVGAGGNYSDLSWPWSGGIGDICYGTSAREQPLPLSSFDGYITIFDVTLALVDKYFPYPVAKQIKVWKSPVGVGAAASISAIFFGVPPAIGALPLIYKAGAIVWGLGVAASTATLSLGAAWYHGYSEVEG